MKQYTLLYVFGLVLLIIGSHCSQKQNIEVFGEHLFTDISILSSDEFEGRAPASKGGILARDYIVRRFTEIGLLEAHENSFLQAVPLVEITPSYVSPLQISTNKNEFMLNYLDDMVIGSYKLDSMITLTNSELVFVGYGIVAPEYNWNDYEGVDVQGKTVVILVNDPGFATNKEDFFTGKAMTYYGRWTYKFEEAVRQGAAGALIIHQTDPAGYGWDVVRNSWSKTQFGIVEQNTSPRLSIEGWLHEDAARSLFSHANINFDSIVTAAQFESAQAITLPMKVSATIQHSIVYKECHNVIGYIPGSEYPDETVIYMAHWDHLGKIKAEDGYDIYNGAVDNATGVAALFALAERYMQELPHPKRSIVFMAVTAEESGLLGSKYYAKNPLFPIETTVAGINIDGLNTYGLTHDIISVGYGFSELELYLKKYAEKQHRTVKPHPYPERGYFYRSDHFSLAQKGIPMIFANGGYDFIGKDAAYSDFVKEDSRMRYHSPQDVIHELWNNEGMYQDIWLFYTIGKDLVESDIFPNWYTGTEFYATRKASEHLRRKP